MGHNQLTFGDCLGSTEGWHGSPRWPRSDKRILSFLFFSHRFCLASNVITQPELKKQICFIAHPNVGRIESELKVLIPVATIQA